MTKAGSNVTVNVHRGTAGLAQISDRWLRLAGAAGDHFLHFPGWYQAELQNRPQDTLILFVTVSRDDELLAVLPFEKQILKKGRLEVPILQLFYQNEMGVDDILSQVDLAPMLGAIKKALRKSAGYFALIRWQCVLASGHATRYCHLASLVKVTHASKYLAFEQGFDAFWAGYSSKFRKTLTKKIRKAEEGGVLRLRCVTNAQELPEAFDVFLALEDSGWKGERGSSIRKQPVKLAYHETLLDAYGRLGKIQINLLYLNDQPLAAHFGIRIGKRLYLLKIGFREDFAAVSPGFIILYKLIEQMSREGELTSISFVTGVDWIDRWHPGVDPAGVAYTDNGDFHSKILIVAMRKYIQRRDARKVVAAPAPPESDDDA